MKINSSVLIFGVLLSACGGSSGSGGPSPATDVVGIWVDEKRAAAAAKFEKDGNLDEACPAFEEKFEIEGKTKVRMLSQYFKIEPSGKSLDCDIHPLVIGKDECREFGAVNGNSLTSKDGKVSGNVTVVGNKGTFLFSMDGRQIKMNQEKLSQEELTRVAALLRECSDRRIPKPPAP